MSQMFHKNIVLNEESIDILEVALEYYPHQPTFTRIYGKMRENFSYDLMKIIYERSLIKLVNLDLRKQYLDIARDIFSRFFNRSDLPSDFMALGHILCAKICLAMNNFTEALYYLHEALIKYPTPDAITAIYCMERLITSNNKEYNVRTISLPKSKYSDNLQSTRLIKMLKKYEGEICNMTNYIEQAFTYIDLSCAVGHPLLSVNCYLMACAYLDQVDEPPNIRYGCKKIIAHLLIRCYLITMIHLDPFSKKHVYGIILDFATKLEKDNMIDMVLQQALEHIIIEYKRISKLIPFSLPLHTCLDTLYLYIVNINYLVYKLKINTSISTFHQYYLFEGLWKGWHDDGDFITERLQCMNNLNSSSVQSVENLMNWPIQEREDGWITGKLQFGNFNDNTETPTSFADIDGFTLNMKTFQLTLMINGTGLFTMDDVFETLKNGIISAFFTLEQPDTKYMSNPYQKMIYGPASMAHSNFLGTLLHADYILKMLSTGVEINGNSPFEIRPFTHDLEFIKPLETNHAHRFWIQAGPVNYSIDENNDVIYGCDYDG